MPIGRGSAVLVDAKQKGEPRSTPVGTRKSTGRLTQPALGPEAMFRVKGSQGGHCGRWLPRLTAPVVQPGWSVAQRDANSKDRKPAAGVVASQTARRQHWPERARGRPQKAEPVGSHASTSGRCHQGIRSACSVQWLVDLSKDERFSVEPCVLKGLRIGEDRRLRWRELGHVARNGAARGRAAVNGPAQNSPQ